MSTAASIYFPHTHYDIKYVQIQNISATTAVLYCMDTSACVIRTDYRVVIVN